MVYTRSYKPSGYRSRKQTMDAIRAQRSAQSAAAAMIRRNPTLRGYARTGGSYTGRFKYGGKSAELKYFDNAISFNFDSTGEVPATGQLCTIPQGVAQTERVGRKITIKKIVAKLTITLATPTDAIGSDILRLALVQDTQANGAAATGTQAGATTAYGNGGAVYQSGFSKRAIITGLAAATTYWFDLSVFVSANTGSVLGTTCTAREF